VIVGRFLTILKDVVKEIADRVLIAIEQSVRVPILFIFGVSWLFYD
jgi:hypothetical protein